MNTRKIRPVLYVLFGMILSAGMLAVVQANSKALSHPTDEQTAQELATIRRYLGADSVRGTYTLSSGEKYVVYTSLRYVDGKLVGHGTISSSAVELLNSPTLSMTAVWGLQEGKTRLVVSGIGSNVEDGAFWQNLDMSQMNNVSSVRPVVADGYVILGFAQSAAIRPESFSVGERGDPRLRGYGDFADALKYKKYVGAIAVRTFRTKEELTAFTDQEWDK